MRFRLVILVLIAALITASTASVAQEKSAKKKVSATETVAMSYACPMHPDVKSDTAGKCSQCGMALEKKEVKMSAACAMKDGAKCTGEKMSSACTMKDGAKCSGKNMSSDCTMKDGAKCAAKCCANGVKEASTKSTKGCCGM